MAASGSNELFWPYVPEESGASNYLADSEQLALNLWGTDSTPPGLTGATTPASLAALPSATIDSGASKQSTARDRQSTNSSGVPHLQDISPPPCGCFSRLLTAMQRVSTHANVCSPALDSVLCANRAASKHCFASLQCPSGSASDINISCTTIACGLLDRILASYQAALDSFCACLHGEKEGDKDKDDEDEGDIMAEPGSIQIRLGAFAMEKSEQVLCAKEIVAREIEKVQETLKGYAEEKDNIRSVLLAHLIKRCVLLIDEITS